MHDDIMNKNKKMHNDIMNKNKNMHNDIMNKHKNMHKEITNKHKNMHKEITNKHKSMHKDIMKKHHHKSHFEGGEEMERVYQQPDRECVEKHEKLKHSQDILRKKARVFDIVDGCLMPGIY